MEEKKKRILQLIEELDFPLVPEEAKEHLEKLSEGDIDELISAYEAILDHRKSVEELAKLSDPEAYKKIQDEYNKKLEQADVEYLKEMGKIQEEEDNERDRIEEEAEKKIDETVNAFLDEVGQIEDTSNELASKIELAAMKSEQN